ncbi:glycoside hydrolase family 47 protein [Durotheca rogersii]|uniref:glycoside hydrolase family 47 protein n=1 Tax=Durotheca rogersii TaxID=419775 RepID=UPI002220447D|nr:glycoside hydrolase family 47 protein [Durotheca rogersii]KAI5861396.1 glycoside hydrolase family 47 protein [Durotheca rogersii]
MSARRAIAILGFASQALGAPSYVSHPDRLEAVAHAFQISWDGYYQYAFPNDTLQPISRTASNDRNGWGASAIDALSTALIMGNKEVIAQVVEHIQQVNFNVTVVGEESVSLFETTIRYLGGLVSAYDFLSGPLSQYAPDRASVDRILEQAVNLADLLSVAFGTPSGVPINTLIFNGPNGPRVADDATNGIATIGTLVLEWTRLSDLTGDDKYARLAQAGEDYLLHVRNPELGEPWPGLIGTNVNVTTGNFTDSSGGWNGGTDSFYEYLIKMYLYDTERFAEYRDRWIAAIDSTIEHLASHPTTRPELTFLAAYNGRDRLNFVSTHLACFDGGNFILGGLTLDKEEYTRFGLDLVEACHETYLATVTGIGPEVFRWQDSGLPANASNNQPPPANAVEFYGRAGFWITASSYVLRPEVVESFYYAYRATGDTKYQDWAWEAFVNINATCAAGVGYSSIRDVNAAGGGGFTDFQESFWFAEVLKYSYLAQAGDAPWQVDAGHNNTWVFNTEAHPFLVKGRPA